MNKLSRKAKLHISLGIVCMIILVSLAIVATGLYRIYYDPAALFRGDFSRPDRVEAHFGERVINVLVLGLHNRNEDNTFGEVYFVDTILLASINFDQDSLTLLAVPRDSYVEIAHAGEKDRIRQSYSYGFREGEPDRHEEGLRYAVETAEMLLDGVAIDYYIAMDLQGLMRLIDSLGGVYYDVEQPMIGFTEQESLSAGPQILDGRGYVNYLTYREPDARDDLNRMNRQKALLLATFDYFKERGLFRNVIPTYTTYRDHIDTDLNLNQVAALTLFAAERLEKDAISEYSLQGEYFSPDGGDTYLLRLDEAEKDRLLDQLRGQGSMP